MSLRAVAPQTHSERPSCRPRCNPTTRIARKTRHFGHAEPSQRPVAHGPGEEEYGFHVEDYEENGDDVEPDGIAAARIRRRFDAALIRFQLGMEGAEGRMSLAATMAITGNDIATTKKIKIGRYPLGMSDTISRCYPSGENAGNVPAAPSVRE